MANGWHGQNIAVFPDLDIVAVVTARKYVSQFSLIEGIYAAVKSESALPPNPNAAASLAIAINAVEQPAVGPTPQLAFDISGKTYRFSDNVLGLRSLTLYLTDPSPRVEYETYTQPTHSLVKSDTPIGLDGSYHKNAPATSGLYQGYIPATKGMWLNARTFEIVTQYLGYGAQRKYLLSFSGEKLILRRTDTEGQEVSIDGERGD